jgi:arginine decarboxylase
MRIPVFVYLSAAAAPATVAKFGHLTSEKRGEEMFTPQKIFLTKGVGFHKEKLSSFEEALRNAGIARFNLVTVSSIYPPHCKVVTKEKGLKELGSGQVTYVVMSRNETDEARRLIAASVGLAMPREPEFYGYLSEHHSFGQTERAAGDYAEDLAASMLATILGVRFDPDASWDEKREIWKISGKIVNTRNVTQSAYGKRNGYWTTVVAAAVLLP